MLHKGNRVVISESCLSSQLPVGEYHYSLFDHVDVFALENPDGKSLLKANESLENENTQLRRESALDYEQASMGRELVMEIQGILKSESRANEIKKKIKRAISESQFEL